MLCRLYVLACRRVGPRLDGRRVTFSAWLWARELEGKGYFWREIVDDTFLVFRDEEDHCMRSFERETRKTEAL